MTPGDWGQFFSTAVVTGFFVVRQFQANKKVKSVVTDEAAATRTNFDEQIKPLKEADTEIQTRLTGLEDKFESHRIQLDNKFAEHGEILKQLLPKDHKPDPRFLSTVDGLDSSKRSLKAQKPIN